MKKPKLKPSARDKRRYLLINEKSNSDIEKAILEYLGILGMAKASYLFVKSKGNKIIGSCLRESLNEIHAALTMSGIKIEKVSGTLKGLES